MTYLYPSRRYPDISNILSRKKGIIVSLLTSYYPSPSSTPTTLLSPAIGNSALFASRRNKMPVSKIIQYSPFAFNVSMCNLDHYFITDDMIGVIEDLSMAGVIYEVEDKTSTWGCIARRQ